MKTKLITPLAIALSLALSVLAGPASAQNGNSPASSGATRTDSRILYHNGPVLLGTQNIYLIWYGNWANRSDDQILLADFVSNLGWSPYFRINSGYPDASGQTPTSALFLAGADADAYSHGATLTEADVADVVAQRVLNSGLPFDPSAIYVVLTSPDIALVDGATQFCLTCCDLHGESEVLGAKFRYVFVGHPAREDTYGTIYAVTNRLGESAEANVKLGSRDYLLQQNWVNSKKAHCSTSYLK
jgi:hypothetical protein